MTGKPTIEQLFRDHGDQIYSLGLRICGSPDAAEDLVQETFLRALSAWEGFEGRSKPSTWLFTIASRACGRMHRRKAGEPRLLEPLERLLPSGEEGIVEMPSDDDPERDAVLREAQDAVLRAVVELPLEFRLPFVLKELADLSVPDVAQVLGLKEGTVKTRLHRGRLQVRRAVAEQLPSRRAPAPDRRREECLALLRAKQEAMDREVPFPVSQSHLCERCRSVFETLDFARNTCRTLQHGEMPTELWERLETALESGNRSVGS